MTILRGITGFHNAKDKELPSIDISAFRSHCQAAALTLQGHITCIASAPTPTANFYKALISFSDRTIAILINRYYPTIAFANPEPDHNNQYCIIDVDSLSACLKGLAKYDLLSATEAKRGLTEDDLKNLTNSEQKQILYWKPITVGSLVFRLIRLKRTWFDEWQRSLA